MTEKSDYQKRLEADSSMKEKLEPDVTATYHGPQSNYLASIAVSMKRVADTLQDIEDSIDFLESSIARIADATEVIAGAKVAGTNPTEPAP